ncbi:MAG TPA: phage holin family protein [Streptosporangiaceae bacterium]|nr:phage holin family protein [Streptosporangiaceae bacterium]
MSEVPPDVQLEDKSLGELVALTSANLSRLVKSEIELAKLELKGDAKRAALGGVMFGVAGVIACVVVILLSIAAAYGLVAAGIYHWAAFLIVSGAYVLLAAVLVGVGYARMRKMSGLRATRRTVTDDLAMLRRSGEPPAITE